MFKKLSFGLCFVVMGFLFFTFSGTAHASEGLTKSQVSDLNKIADQYNMEIEFNLDPSEITVKKEFESVEEFESYLKEKKLELDYLSEQNTQDLNTIDLLKSPNTIISPMASRYHVETWWTPRTGVLATPLAFMKIGFNYHYAKDSLGGYSITKLTNITSWQTGASDVKWIHRGSDYIKRGRHEVGVTVKGTYVLGIVIDGKPLGYSWSKTWDRHIM